MRRGNGFLCSLLRKGEGSNSMGGVAAPRKSLEAPGVEFIDENGDGPSVPPQAGNTRGNEKAAHQR
jgi:hypothetical protein